MPSTRNAFRVPFLVVTFALAAARSADAQALGYGIAGPAGFSGFFGSSSSGVHAAAGGEVLAGGFIGGGAEIGLLGNSGSVLAVFSANGVVHVVSSRAKRPSPFVTGGYTRMSSGEGSFKAWNVGVGVDLWPKDHVGVRVEFRDHVRPDSRGAVQYWTIRAGVVFR